MAKALKSEGFISDFIVHEKKPQNELTLVLKYGPNREPVITGIKRESKPGLRHYVHVREIPRVKGGMGVAILSTSRGVMVDQDDFWRVAEVELEEARQNLGEVLVRRPGERDGVDVLNLELRLPQAERDRILRQ